MPLIGNSFQKIIFKATFVFSTVAFFSCKDELSTNPFEIFDSGLTAKVDTFTLIGNTVLDTAYTLNKLPLAPIGILQDPDFGNTEAAVFTNFELPSNEINIGDATLDSIVLTLASGSSYGPIAGPVNIEVYEVNTRIENKLYRNTKGLSYTPVKIGQLADYKTNYTDSVEVLGVKYGPHIRVKLDDIIGQSFVKQTASTGFKDNASFQNFFKGVFIKTNGVNNGLIYLNLLNALSKLTLYYNNAGVQKTLDFRIGNNSNYVGNYVHNYPAALTIPTNNPTGENALYLQGLAGTRAKVELPYIQNVSSLALTKAELVVTVDKAPFPLPPKLFLNQADTLEASKDVADFYLPTFNGKLQSNLVDGKIVYQYRINITRHIQKLINKEIANKPLYIYANDVTLLNGTVFFIDYLFRGSRIKIGGNDPSSKIKLELTYLK